MQMMYHKEKHSSLFGAFKEVGLEVKQRKIIVVT
jgi:hypothetical protein